MWNVKSWKLKTCWNICCTMCFKSDLQIYLWKSIEFGFLSVNAYCQCLPFIILLSAFLKKVDRLFFFTKQNNNLVILCLAPLQKFWIETLNFLDTLIFSFNTRMKVILHHRNNEGISLIILPIFCIIRIRSILPWPSIIWRKQLTHTDFIYYLVKICEISNFQIQ